MAAVFPVNILTSCQNLTMPARSRRKRLLKDRRQSKFTKTSTYVTIKDTWSSDSDDSECESDSWLNAINGWESPSPVNDGKQSRSNETNEDVPIQYKPCPDGHNMFGEYLPPELLLKIFSMAVKENGALPCLVRISGVCHSWRSAACDSTLWRHVDLAEFKVKDSGTLRWLVDNRLSRATKLSLPSWGQLKSEDYMHLFDSCRQLQSLDLSYCNLTRTAIEALGSLPHLQSVNLSGAPDAIMVPSVLCPMLRNLGPRLTELNLSNTNIKRCVALMNALMDNCPNITVLDLSSCTYSSSRKFLNIERLQKCCPKLRILRLHNSKLPAVEGNQEEMVASSGFPDLEELNIAVLSMMYGNGSVLAYDDDFITRLLRNSPRLRHLDVSMCFMVSDISLLTIPAKQLTSLRVKGCSDTGVYRGIHDIINKWKGSLEYVDLSWNNYYPHDSLEQALYVMGQHGTPVRSLNLAGTKVSSEAIRTVLMGCRQLTTLDLTCTSSGYSPLDGAARRRHEGRKALDDLLKTLS